MLPWEIILKRLLFQPGMELGWLKGESAAWSEERIVEKKLRVHLSVYKRPPLTSSGGISSNGFCSLLMKIYIPKIKAAKRKTLP